MAPSFSGGHFDVLLTKSSVFPEFQWSFSDRCRNIVHPMSLFLRIAIRN